MRSYASGTTVSEAKSHFEISLLLKRYGCEGTGYAEHEGEVRFMFAKNGQTYRFTIRLPESEDAVKVDSNYRPSKHGSRLDYERSRKTRALVAVIKAQLVAIEEGITSFEEMFIGQVVTDNGQTIAERWAPEAKQRALEGRFPSALPGGSK